MAVYISNCHGFALFNVPDITDGRSSECEELSVRNSIISSCNAGRYLSDDKYNLLTGSCLSECDGGLVVKCPPCCWRLRGLAAPTSSQCDWRPGQGPLSYSLSSPLTISHLYTAALLPPLVKQCVLGRTIKHICMQFYLMFDVHLILNFVCLILKSYLLLQLKLKTY